MAQEKQVKQRLQKMGGEPQSTSSLPLTFANQQISFGNKPFPAQRVAQNQSIFEDIFLKPRIIEQERRIQEKEQDIEKQLLNQRTANLAKQDAERRKKLISLNNNMPLNQSNILNESNFLDN